MKQAQPRQKVKLTNGLLIVALLFGLFAFLGDVGNCQTRLEPTTRIELFVADRQEFGQHELVSERPKNVVPKQFFAYPAHSIVALLAYNKLISYQISRVCSTPTLTTLISKFFQSKTIPASSEAPHANGY